MLLKSIFDVFLVLKLIFVIIYGMLDTCQASHGRPHHLKPINTTLLDKVKEEEFWILRETLANFLLNPHLVNF